MNPFDSAYWGATNTTPLPPLPFAIKPHPFTIAIVFSYNSCFHLPSVVCSFLREKKEVLICGVIVFDDMPVRRSSNHIPSSPVVQDMQPPIKQGIVTILGADCDRNTRAGSIRKTLSADMSSKKWLQQNGFFSPIKKIDSSQEIAMAAAEHSPSSEVEEEPDDNPNQDDVWRSIQESNEMQKPYWNGVWGSILTQKSDSSLLPPPYVFPSVKRSTSCLSDKSLEICTESLGSETGTDCFSGYGATEGLSCDGDEEREHVQSEGEEVRGTDTSLAYLHVVKNKNSPVRPFPPPLPSVAGSDGASLRMHSHRENGRLVLEAVSVAPRNYFHAQRQDGRLVLTLLHGPTSLGVEQEKSEFEEVFDNMEAVGEDVKEAVEEEGESGLEEEEEEYVVEQNLSLPTGMISVHKSGLVMKKLITVGNINPKWSNKLNKGDEFLTGDEEQQLPILQSLPPRPPMARLITSPPPPAAATSFNAYEYFWRSKPTTTIPGGLVNPMLTTKNKINQDLVVVKASKTEQSYTRGCKEARRSLIWEPCCIATS